MKKLREGRCIHCLQYKNNVTDDHIIPRSWYSNYSKNIYKPIAPACYECNQKLGKQEKKISHLMWMCMPETNPLREELVAKVFRACGSTPDGKPLPGLDRKERRIRKLYAQKLVSLAEPSNGFDEANAFPGFGYHSGYPREIQKITRLDGELVSNLAIKVVRGFEYIQQGKNRYIEKPYVLDVYFPKNPHEPSLEIIRKKSPLFSDGTNSIQRSADPTRPLEPVYIIRLWNQWEIWGVIMHQERKTDNQNGPPITTP